MNNLGSWKHNTIGGQNKVTEKNLTLLKRYAHNRAMNK